MRIRIRGRVYATLTIPQGGTEEPERYRWSHYCTPNQMSALTDSQARSLSRDHLANLDHHLIASASDGIIEI